MFCFRLALALGMTVAEMLARISARELMEWMAYYRLEPFGQERDNLHAAIVAATAANANRDPKRRPVDTGVFMLRSQAVLARDDADLWRRLKQWATHGNTGNTRS